MKVILLARDIQDGTVVRKINGTTDYTFRKEITIHSDGSTEPQRVKSEGVNYLVSSTGSINAIQDIRELVLKIEPQDLINFIEENILAPQ